MITYLYHSLVLTIQGKSTLLRGLLGEIDLLKGYSGCRLGTVGYCSQDPWLLNRSIRGNITFMFPYDPVWYREVTTALALDIDMAILTDGDLTLVGNLSGGQKQRVALARAVYGKFHTYVLDDVLSALDATTGSHVFSALFGAQGLLSGRTVIMTTNQVYRLPQASHISYLKDGRVVEQGTYDVLMDKGGLLADLVKEFNTGKKAEVVPEPEQANDTLPEPVEDARSEHQEEGEVSAKGGVKWSTYGLYLKGMGKTHATICKWIAGSGDSGRSIH
jgi:ABC-type methionine transport system ATPase subunit